MGPSHTQPHIHEENGAVEAAPCLRPLSPSGRRRRKPAACGAAMLAACALALALALAAPQPAEALGGISGICYVACTNAHIDGPDGGNVFEVTFPEYGITATGYCISGSVYGTPLPGTYPFTGEPADDGGFQITVNCRGAGMYENHYSPYGAQNVGGFKLYPFGSVEVLKRSAAPEVTDGNPCYRLDGAAYGVYADEACTREALSLTTDSSGRARSERVLAPGRYWVREKAAPEGYLPDPGTYPVDLAQEDCRTGAVPALHVEDAPLLAPVDALVQKADRETGVPVPLGDASLAGATFTVEHYAGRYASLGEIAAAGAQPARTWDVVTDEQGRASVGTGDLPGNGSGGSGLPLGTVVVREVQAPRGYLLPDPPALVRAVEPSPDEPGVAVYRVPTVADQVVRGDVALLKLGAGKDGGGAADSTGEGGAVGASADGGGTTPKVPLGGVAFDIVHLSTGEVAARLVTGEDGRASTEGLRPEGLDGALPYGLYEVREDPATTPPGYRTAEPFAVAVESNARTYCYEVVNELASAPEEPPAGNGPAEEAPPALLAETGDALARAPRCTALAAVVSATLAAAFALRRQRP